jgi:hypothetical protein
LKLPYVLACDVESELNSVGEQEHMRVRERRNLRYRFILVGLLLIGLLRVFPVPTYAQNLGEQPATGQAVQGRTAAQPEGTVLNLVNWPQRSVAVRWETIKPIHVFEVRDGDRQQSSHTYEPA